MVSIRPVAKALIPVDTVAANAVSAPNYDEFQSDDEVFDMLRARPDNVLKVTMPHVAVTAKSLYLEEGGEQALNTAAVNMRHLEDAQSDADGREQPLHLRHHRAG